MAFVQTNTLKSQTYLGLIVAQFLAAFNDQCIHASAMFYAIHQGALKQETAISLMPILFYAPWAVFCTLAGYLADRFSKRNSLIFWKIAEIGITFVALAGFWLGTVEHNPIGPYLVLSTVFLMGTHSAFFVPAKYGVMPEILQPSALSRGNGVLESTSFLAVILGTVTGGILSSEAVFKGREVNIGITLVALAVVGAAASFLIRKMPAANPDRPFPWNLFKPLFTNLRTMLRSRPLALAVLGIAFFTFMVAFMRATMYMHGETRNPHWSEFTTSLVVATVALGVGLGSPLAGFLSGGKVELGLVPFGAVGMIVACLLAAFALFWTPGLIASLIVIGFYSGFYIVPLYTLLQHRAPKTSKGDLIATSNFINVTGAILASLLFFSLVGVAHRTWIAPEVEQHDNLARGELKALRYEKGRHAYLEVDVPGPHDLVVHVRRRGWLEADATDDEEEKVRIVLDEDLIDVVGGGVQPRTADSPGSEVIVSTYTVSRQGVPVVHYKVRLADQPLKPAYDNELLPRFLFIGAGLMTVGVLAVLLWQLPDFFVRMILWLRSLGRYRLRVIGMDNLPGDGPVILATNCDRVENCLQVLSVTDRFTRFVLLDHAGGKRPSLVLRYLALRTRLAVLRPGEANGATSAKALERALQSLQRGEIIGLPANGEGTGYEVDGLLRKLQERLPSPVVPVYCGPLGKAGSRQVHIVIGPPLPPTTPVEAIRHEIHRLRDGADPSQIV